MYILTQKSHFGILFNRYSNRFQTNCTKGKFMVWLHVEKKNLSPQNRYWIQTQSQVLESCTLQPCINPNHLAILQYYMWCFINLKEKVAFCWTALVHLYSCSWAETDPVTSVTVKKINVMHVMNLISRKDSCTIYNKNKYIKWTRVIHISITYTLYKNMRMI